MLRSLRRICRMPCLNCPACRYPAAGLCSPCGKAHTLFSWAAYQLGRMPELEYLHHVPNGGKRDKATATALIPLSPFRGFPLFGSVPARLPCIGRNTHTIGSSAYSFCLSGITNGGKRDKATATALKRQGVKAGVPDVVLPAVRAGYHGLYYCFHSLPLFLRRL